MANVVRMVIQLRRATTEEWIQNKDVKPAAGEPCFDITANTLKIGNGIDTYENLKPIGGTGSISVAPDGSSIVLSDGVFKLAGFDAAEVGAIPRKNANNELEWYVPSKVSVDDLHDAITELQSIVGATESGESGTLLDRITALETGVNTLNGSQETVGSVLKIVKDEINAFAEKVSGDDTVNTFKELIDYVSDHGKEFGVVVSDVALLKELVGNTSVYDQIVAGTSGKVDVEEGKSLVSDALIAKLEAIDSGAQANVIDGIYVGETLLDVVDKKVVVPIGAGLKASEEITIATDGTIGIGKISFSKIVQEENETIVMDGGTAAG